MIELAFGESSAGSLKLAKSMKQGKEQCVVRIPEQIQKDNTIDDYPYSDVLKRILHSGVHK